MEPYVSGRTIKTYITLLTGCCDIAELINKLYQDDFLETSREWYILHHNPYKVSYGSYNIKTKVGSVDVTDFWAYMNPRLYYLEDIKMIGHCDFISKTNRDLSQLGCKGVFNTLYLGCPPSNDEDYNREVDILLNEEKIKLSMFEKLDILQRIQEYSIKYCSSAGKEIWLINEIMYNHYLQYITTDNLYITGYLIDSKNVIYGV